jgi:hypothetical protein
LLLIPDGDLAVVLVLPRAFVHLLLLVVKAGGDRVLHLRVVQKCLQLAHLLPVDYSDGIETLLVLLVQKPLLLMLMRNPGVDGEVG